MRSWEAHSISLPRLLIMVVDSPVPSLNSLRSLAQAPKTPESLSLPDSHWNTFIPFCGLLYSSPDVPTRPELLPAYPTSCLNTPLSISRHKTSKGFLTDSLLASQSTLNCPLNSCSFSSHSFSLVLGLIVMVGWISLIGREGTLAQVCFPEFGAARKDVEFDMLHNRPNSISTG